MGGEIKTLVDAEAPVGSHTVVFNGAELPAGVYFYQMKAGNYSAVKKMIVTK